MQIEILMSKTKLTKSIVKQMNAARPCDIEWAYENKGSALGYVTFYPGYAKMCIIKGISDYYLLPIVNTEVTGPHQGSQINSSGTYETEYRVTAERYRRPDAVYGFSTREAAEEFNSKLKTLMNLCKANHIYA
ncbi:hypothetical protein CPT_Muldoon_086 [Serratia phage Muldoon]|uniref:Uncharacterized protein n=1 Tax=Serratia phage Muldoon TaxID=2601678 RepID=A0A5P8PH86_9CAUD|nr:hypothetical protein HYP94_gp085 [Serratia phage Muldoon]QFR56041.1 hypothetical protein CPT_Muldoon_086 [Serratia phage Muldoon]